MKTPRTSISAHEASEAICSVLDTLSFIRRQDIRLSFNPEDSRLGLLLRVSVFGREHILACALHARVFPEGLEAALFDVHSAAMALGYAVLPVIIAPELSPEAQAQCREHHIAYVDLEGNAYLDVGEIFVACRAVYPRQHQAPIARQPVASVSPHLSALQTGSFPC